MRVDLRAEHNTEMVWSVVSEGDDSYSFYTDSVGLQVYGSHTIDHTTTSPSDAPSQIVQYPADSGQLLSHADCSHFRRREEEDYGRERESTVEVSID